MTDPSVSVIIPTYNYGHFIEQALSSVYAQTYRDFEVIVVDDGSTDNTKERVAGFPETRYVYQAQHSIIATIARGIAEARGRYVALLDADDVWMPRKLEIQMPVFHANRVLGLVACGYELIDETGSVLPQRSMPTARSLLDLKAGSSCLPSTWVFPIDLFHQVDGFQGCVGHPWDWDFLLRLVLRGFALRPVHAYLVQRRLHTQQQAADPRLLLEGKLCVIHRRHRALEASPYRWHWRQMLYGAYVEAAADYAATGRLDDAGNYFERAMRLWPDMISRPATFFGFLNGMNPYGYQTIQNTSRCLVDFHARVRRMVALAGRRHKRRAVRNGLDPEITNSALGLGACMVCLRAGALPRALAWLGRTFIRSPTETAQLFRMMAVRRLPGRSPVASSSVDGKVRTGFSCRAAIPSGHKNRAGSTP